jgi:hypothetical protein
VVAWAATVVPSARQAPMPVATRQGCRIRMSVSSAL